MNLLKSLKAACFASILLRVGWAAGVEGGEMPGLPYDYGYFLSSKDEKKFFPKRVETRKGEIKTETKMEREKKEEDTEESEEMVETAKTVEKKEKKEEGTEGKREEAPPELTLIVQQRSAFPSLGHAFSSVLSERTTEKFGVRGVKVMQAGRYSFTIIDPTISEDGRIREKKNAPVRSFSNTTFEFPKLILNRGSFRITVGCTASDKMLQRLDSVVLVKMHRVRSAGEAVNFKEELNLPHFMFDMKGPGPIRREWEIIVEIDSEHPLEEGKHYFFAVYAFEMDKRCSRTAKNLRGLQRKVSFSDGVLLGKSFPMAVVSSSQMAIGCRPELVYTQDAQDFLEPTVQTICRKGYHAVFRMRKAIRRETKEVLEVRFNKKLTEVEEKYLVEVALYDFDNKLNHIFQADGWVSPNKPSQVYVQIPMGLPYGRYRVQIDRVRSEEPLILIPGGQIDSPGNLKPWSANKPNEIRFTDKTSVDVISFKVTLKIAETLVCEATIDEMPITVATADNLSITSLGSGDYSIIITPMDIPKELLGRQHFYIVLTGTTPLTSSNPSREFLVGISDHFAIVDERGFLPNDRPICINKNLIISPPQYKPGASTEGTLDLETGALPIPPHVRHSLARARLQPSSLVTLPSRSESGYIIEIVEKTRTPSPISYIEPLAGSGPLARYIDFSNSPLSAHGTPFKG
jgi:hypothetical protein